LLAVPAVPTQPIWPDGTTSAAPPLEPYQPTPPLPALSDQRAPEPEPVVECIDDNKIAVLRRIVVDIPATMIRSASSSSS
jgi:hypothetical protein